MKLSRLNPSTLIGIFASLLLLAIVLMFASNDPSMYVNLPGLAIVLGGTFAATFIAYPLREVLRIFALVRTVFSRERSTTGRDIEDLTHIAQIWSRHDVHQAEQALQEVHNPYLRSGVQLVIDNTPDDEVADFLQWRIARLRAREQAEAQLFRVMAGFAPAFGMIGTLVGLVNMLTMLGDGDIQAIGQQMAIALMTTFYGILLANLVCKPIAVKLERRTEQRVLAMNTLMYGIGLMAERRSPAVLRETLQAFMADYEDEMHDSRLAQRDAGTPAGAPARPAATPR
ncbi:chemotaxis protein MotA [Verticiella sediminum]|uniref:Chemotaxis protein MotA n=1 Tax=Verticiella sediminum TaxID=1247510 RepID=A0A556AKM5_9BURK|nr:MotA/TolQ/ExbB proton channel family protein [Verticiella sediminum]TSH93436.1 chemotaxis protein MotA [Verticiella sediminum]